MDNKEIFQIVKYFKSIYTNINLGEELFFNGNEFFLTDSSYYIISGKLKEISLFNEWAKDKTFSVKLSSIDRLRKCLKVNIVGMSIDDISGEFKIKYMFKSNDGDLIPEEFSIIPKTINNNLKTKVDQIEKLLDRDFIIDPNIFQNELVTIYLNNDSLSTEKENISSQKIFEFPAKRIKSFMTDSKCSVSINDPLDDKKYIKISCENDTLVLSQIFAIIY